MKAPRTAKAGTGARALKILARLTREHPDARCLLNYRSPLELLIGTILAAQCTDERVNQVTPGLFKTYRTAKAFAQADPKDLEEAIRSTGFFRNKAKSIQGCCQRLIQEHGGEVPRDLEALTALPGVGRKTANVVMGVAYEQPAIIVDTHVIRLSGRLGLSKEQDPDRIEGDLQRLIPKGSWTRFSNVLGFHGRRVCIARKPNCEACVIQDLCPHDRTDR